MHGSHQCTANKKSENRAIMALSKLLMRLGDYRGRKSETDILGIRSKTMDEFEIAGKETKCKYNAMVDCRGGACLKCGWNPKAAQERIQRMMCKRIQNRGVSATYYDESMENKDRKSTRLNSSHAT